MIYLINKNLPWDSIDDNEKIKNLKIKIKKEYKSIPYIQSYLAYIFSLKQDSFIDYQYLNNTLNVQEYDINYMFDEINMEQKPAEFEEMQSTQEKNSSIISNSPKNQLQTNSLLDIFNENAIIKGMKRVFSQNTIF